MSPASDQSSCNHLSPCSAHPAPRGGGDGGLSAPWAQVVRGEPEAVPAASPSPPRPASISPPAPADRSPPYAEDAASSSMPPPPSSVPPPSESPDQGSNGNVAARGKKPAWNMPSNGFNEAGHVMGADSWPPLSESARASSKLSSSDSLKALSDGSVSAPPKPNSNHPNPNSSLNHAAPVRQKSIPNSKSMRRGGGGGGSSSGASTNGGSPPPLSPPASAETAQIIPDKQSGPEPSATVHPNGSNSNWHHGLRSNGFTPKQHGSGDHHGGYGGNRRGNSGGGRSHHGAYRSWRDHERGGYDWNPLRGFSGRDAHMLLPPQQHRGHPRPFPRQPPPSPAPFVSPPPHVRPFLSPMGFAEIPAPVYYIPAHPPLESLRNMPFVAHQVPHAIPPTMFVNGADHQRALLLKQIEYYFSSDNLCKDIYLRQRMDGQGWVHISLIAGFNRVKQLTNNIPYILDTIRGSDIVEVQGENIRRRNDWVNWILPSRPNQYSTSSRPSSPATSNYDSLAAGMHNVGLGERAANPDNTRGQTWAEEVLSRSASGHQNDLSHVGEPNGKGNGQGTGHTESD
ncbi:la-related protein 1C-like [Phoenix dactylifera]|uniref:La-related protein 1C-like n=1 Tax=Phoenix dactylifera TaxID=42345 RepID=A0A8B7D2E2_PHODC|nr:la-related protein 1C-like [Phoenix dactylifera]